MIYIFLFILGTAIGSFLNVLIDRLPNGQSIGGRSHCDHCKKQLSVLDLIPILSFFLLKGKCRYCKKRLTFVYLLVELITGVAFIYSWLYINQDILEKIAFMGILSCLIVIFFADAKYRIIPDSIQIGLFLFSLIFVSIKGLHPELFLNLVKASFITMLPILFLFMITHGKGMGFGDVKLSFTMGLLLGIPLGLLAIYIGFIIGAVIGLILMVLGKKGLKSKIAFGPFLVAGTATTLFWGKIILAFAQKALGF